MKHFRLPSTVVSREKFIIDACGGKSVLHVGCADSPYTDGQIAAGRWLHTKLTAVAKRCIGVDLDCDTVELLKAKYGVTDICVGDAENLDALDLGQFDVIVAGEIIEHLNNPGRFLGSAKSVLAPNGLLLITTTNAFTLRRLVRVGFGTESIHPDHTYYFSHTTLETLARRFGYRLVERHSYHLESTAPLLPFLFERIAVVFAPNWGQGIVHVYAMN